MIRILKIDDNVFATSAKGTLTKEDYNKILPLIKEKLRDTKEPSWYFEMENFEGWEPKALLEDFKFDVTHLNDFKKIAMVGDKKWQEIMTDLVKPFSSSKIEFFNLEDREKAKNWVKS